MPNYLKEAFKELELLDEEVFPFNKDGAADLQKFLDGDITDDTESIIDPEADSEEDLQKSYEGKVIISCKICHDMQYKDPQDIVIDEESDYVNVGEECPSCSSVDGYKIVGQVAPYCAECDKEGEDVEVEETKVVEESLNEKRETGLADVVQQMLDGEFYDMVKSEKTGKMQSVGRKPIVNSNDIGLDENGLSVRVKDDETAAKVKEVADKFGLETKYEPAHKYDRDKRAVVHIYISEEDWDKDVSEHIFNEAMNESAGTIYDEVLKVLDDNGYDTKDKDVMAYAESAAEYIEMTRAETDRRYSVSQWFKDTQQNYPEDLKELKRLEETCEKKAMTECDAKNNRPHLKGNKDLEEPITESVENVTVETDSDTVTVTPTEGGDVKVETQSKEEVEPEAETIVPVDSETKDEIDMNDHNFDDTATNDLDLDDIELDTEEFDSLGESYLKKVYGNVESYKTSAMKKEDGKLMFEGVITFASGKKAKTSFIFENIVKTRSGKVKFIGENLQLSTNKKAFTITASVDGKKGICESFNYNYIAKDSATGKRVPLYGTIKK